METTIPITYAHLTLAPGESITWDVEEGHTTLAHVFDGAANVNGTEAESGQLVVLASTSGSVELAAAANGSGAEVLLLAGEPIREPIARYGPFVMNTRAEIVQAVNDFNAGRLGSIPAEGSGITRT